MKEPDYAQIAITPTQKQIEKYQKALSILMFEHL
jgi:hypothetical protein